MSELIEPPPTAGRHADGAGVGEKLAEHLAAGQVGDHGQVMAKGDGLREAPKGHMPTHFDEPSLDYAATDTKIDETTLTELRTIAGRYPQARSALLPMLHLVQS